MNRAGSGTDIPGVGCFASIIGSWCAIGLILGTAATCGSCSPSVSTQTRVNYAMEAARCDENERAIIAREDTTLEEDTAAMAAERIRCDEARAAILDGGTP